MKNYHYFIFALLPFLLFLGVPCTTSAQTPPKKTKNKQTLLPVPIETRIALLDSAAHALQMGTATLTAHKADRKEGSSKETVFAYSADANGMDSLLVVQNTQENENGHTENHFYLKDGKIFCWTLLRIEVPNQSPRPRKRFAKYYLDNGVVFHAVEQVGLVQEEIFNKPFVPMPVAELQTMTDFMNRKYQYILDAFRQGWKVTGN